jgi:hypothetical protein
VSGINGELSNAFIAAKFHHFHLYVALFFRYRTGERVIGTDGKSIPSRYLDSIFQVRVSFSIVCLHDVERSHSGVGALIEHTVDYRKIMRAISITI